MRLMRMSLHHSYLYCPKHQVLGNTAGLWFRNALAATTKNSFQSHTLTTWICMLNLAMSTTCCSRPCGSLAWQWSIEAGELLARCSSLSTVLGVWGPQCIRKSAPGNSIEALLSICQFDWASWVDVQNWQENYWNILKWWFLPFSYLCLCFRTFCELVIYVSGALPWHQYPNAINMGGRMWWNPTMVAL